MLHSGAPCPAMLRHAQCCKSTRIVDINTSILEYTPVLLYFRYYTTVSLKYSPNPSILRDASILTCTVLTSTQVVPSYIYMFNSPRGRSLSELVKTNVSEACSLEELLSWEDIGVCVLALPKWIGSLKASSRSRSALHMRARERARGR